MKNSLRRALALIIALLLALPSCTFAENQDLVASGNVDPTVEETGPIELGGEGTGLPAGLLSGGLTIDHYDEVPEENPGPTLDSSSSTEDAPPAAFDRSVTVDGVTVTVTASAGVFPEDANLRVEKVESDAIAQAAQSAVGAEGGYTHRLFRVGVQDDSGNALLPDKAQGTPRARVNGLNLTDGDASVVMVDEGTQAAREISAVIDAAAVEFDLVGNAVYDILTIAPVSPEETSTGEQPPANEAQPVSVAFDIAPETASVTVRPADGGEAIPAQADGSFLLLPGEYAYTAGAEGYVSVENVPFTVADESLTLIVALEAAEDPDVPVIEEVAPEQVFSPDEGDADNDALLDAYVQRMIDASLGQSPTRLRRGLVGNSLSGNDYAVYTILKSAVADIANGTSNKSEIPLTVDAMNQYGGSFGPWTAEQLGVEALVENGNFTEAAKAAIKAQMAYDLSSVIHALLADCPYELYWFDKTASRSTTGYSITTKRIDGEWVINITDPPHVKLPVAPAYADEGSYTVNSEKVAAAQTAIATAQGIVANATGDTLARLTAYKEAICNAVSYNDDAIFPSWSGGYGDPWQLIYVFDGDNTTNVVCEGYSKAFKYLCDLSDFGDDFDCLMVSGTMYGGTGSGGHMWNVVHMPDGKHYLVDVTNCDDGAVGSPDKLFMVKAPYGTWDDYSFNVGNSSVRYAYYDTTKSNFSQESLTISDLTAENPNLLTLGANTFPLTPNSATDRPFTPAKSGSYRFWSEGDLGEDILLGIFVLSGNNVIAKDDDPGYSDGNPHFDLTCALEANTDYTIRVINYGAGDMDGLTVNLAYIPSGVSYLDASGQTQTCETYTVLTASTDRLEDGKWYVAAPGTLTIGSRVEVEASNGDEVHAHLILCDGADLTVVKGIGVSNDNSLTIYAQSAGSGMGALTVTGAQSYCAGIGGNQTFKGGTITINGGKITVTGSQKAAGIGGGNGSDGGTITINGGDITATGGDSAAGIGGGYQGAGDTVEITGGTVTARGGENAAGIGGGYQGAGDTVEITGGTVTANGGTGGVGIGGAGVEDGSLTVGFASADHSLTANSYSCAVQVASGKILSFTDTDSVTHYYAGKLTDDEKSAIAGQTLVKNNTAHIIYKSATEHGTVTSSPSAALANTSVTLIVEPDADYMLDKLTYTPAGDDPVEITSDENGVYSFLMPTEDVTVTATFKKDCVYYTVVFKDDDGTVLSSAEYETGTAAADIVKPADPTKEGFKFLGWYQVMDDQGTLADTPFEFENTPIQADITLRAKWAEPVTLTATTRTIASADPLCTPTLPSGTIYAGDEVTVSVTAQPGYSFIGWFNADAASFEAANRLAATLRYTFAIEGDTGIVAVYKAIEKKGTLTVNTQNGAQFRIGSSLTVQDIFRQSYTVGTVLTLTAVDPDKVLSWQNESAKVIGTADSIDVTVTGDMTITLVYRATTAGQAFVRFVTDYDQILAYRNYSSDDTKVDFPDAPTKFGYTFDKWVFDGTDTEATSEAILGKVETEPMITVRPSYTKDQTTYSVSVNYVDADGQSIGSGSQVYDDLVVGTNHTFNAPAIDGYKFSCWKNAGGTVLSYKTGYYMKVESNTTLRACYVTEEVEVEIRPVITIGVPYTVASGDVHKVANTATRSIPTGYTLIEHGMLYARNVSGLTDETFVYGTEGVNKYVSNDRALNSFLKLNVKVTDDTIVVYHRGYMILRDEATGNEETYYSDFTCGSYSSICSVHDTLSSAYLYKTGKAPTTPGEEKAVI